GVMLVLNTQVRVLAVPNFLKSAQLAWGASGCGGRTCALADPATMSRPAAATWTGHAPTARFMYFILRLRDSSPPDAVGRRSLRSMAVHDAAGERPRLILVIGYAVAGGSVGESPSDVAASRTAIASRIPGT